MSRPPPTASRASRPAGSRAPDVVSRPLVNPPRARQVTAVDAARVRPRGHVGARYRRLEVDTAHHVFDSSGRPPAVRRVMFRRPHTAPGPSRLLGQPVEVPERGTFTATVTGSYGTPTGTVTFYDRCTALGSVTLDSHSVHEDPGTMSGGRYWVKRGSARRAQDRHAQRQPGSIQTVLTGRRGNALGQEKVPSRGRGGVPPRRQCRVHPYR